MNIFSILTLIGGLAFFLFGMNVMSTGLEKMSGGKLETTLEKMTSTKFKSLALGAGITIAIQSSSAMMVMLVGLVNSGIMQFGQTIGIIMGSNIGTTLTAWLLSLTGIESSNFLIQMLKPESFAPILAFIGICMLMLSKNGRKKDIGSVLVGFAVLMQGMTLMSSAVKPLADMPEFTRILTMFANPIIGVLIGTIFTGVIQSSAASVGILQALSLTGSITYQMAIPIIMGQNIGTCVTSLISSIGTNTNAKRVAAVHIYFNLIGTIICLVVYYGLNAIFRFAFVDTAIGPFGIAVVHSIFNVATTFLLLPFTKQLEKLACMTVREKRIKGVIVPEEYTLLDKRLLHSPSFAIDHCRNMTVNMAEMACDTMVAAIGLFDRFEEAVAKMVRENENTIDLYEDKIGSYLVKLSGKELTDEDSKEVSKLLHIIGDIERIGDHAVNVMQSAKEMYEKKIRFSPEATRELAVANQALIEILTMTLRALKENDVELAYNVEPLEQVIDELRAEMKIRHIIRLKEGMCTIELGFIYSDLLTSYERVGDHCSNIAICLIQIRASENFDIHGYMDEVKTSGHPGYQEAFNRYKKTYELPQRAFIHID